MISKEQERTDRSTVWQNSRRYRITGSTDRYPDSKNQ